jgi:hypothetical protein
MVLPFFFPAGLILGSRIWKRRRTWRGEDFRLIQIRLTTPSLEKSRLRVKQNSSLLIVQNRSPCRLTHLNLSAHFL